MEKTSKGKIALALILSLLVGIVGAALWGLLYSQGWFASIIAYFSAFLMFTVYTKFHKVNTLAFVWILAWTLVLNAVACLLTILIAVAIEADVSIGVAFNAFVETFGEIAGEFILDLGLSALFGVLGVVSYYSVYKKKLAVQREKAKLLTSVEQSEPDNVEKTEVKTDKETEQNTGEVEKETKNNKSEENK